MPRSKKKDHVHYWIHVGTRDWHGRQTLVCKCVGCDRTLTPSQIIEWRKTVGARP